MGANCTGPLHSLTGALCRRFFCVPQLSKWGPVRGKVFQVTGPKVKNSSVPSIRRTTAQSKSARCQRRWHKHMVHNNIFVINNTFYKHIQVYLESSLASWRNLALPFLLTNLVLMIYIFFSYFPCSQVYRQSISTVRWGGQAWWCLSGAVGLGEDPKDEASFLSRRRRPCYLASLVLIWKMGIIIGPIIVHTQQGCCED